MEWGIKMLIKVLIAIAIILMMTGPLPIKSQSMKASISDKEIEAMITIIDKAVVSYYVSHAGVLPTELNGDVRLIMGLGNIDMTPFTYAKVDDNTFSLQGRLSSRSIQSANSGVNLIAINPMTE